MLYALQSPLKHESEIQPEQHLPRSDPVSILLCLIDFPLWINILFVIQVIESAL